MWLDSSCWGTRIRTRKGRTRICSVTITPYPNLFASTLSFRFCGCKGTTFLRTAKIFRDFFIKILKKRRDSILITRKLCIFARLKCINLHFHLMESTEKLVRTIIKGIQEKKGSNIAVADLSGIDGTICHYFVICQGNSPAQVEAIAESVGDMARMELKE